MDGHDLEFYPKTTHKRINIVESLTGSIKVVKVVVAVAHIKFRTQIFQVLNKLQPDGGEIVTIIILVLEIAVVNRKGCVTVWTPFFCDVTEFRVIKFSIISGIIFKFSLSCGKGPVEPGIMEKREGTVDPVVIGIG